MEDRGLRIVGLHGSFAIADMAVGLNRRLRIEDSWTAREFCNS